MKSKDQQLLVEAYNKVRLSESNEVAALEKFASDLHEIWRAGWIKQNQGKSVPRMKKGSTGEQVDINVPFAKLDPAWRKENEEAAKAALASVKQFPDDEEAAAEYIHDEWMKRNPKGDWNAAQHVPYSSLPDDEKEKDRVHFRNMKALSKQ
jgi:hypothetical protein